MKITLDDSIFEDCIDGRRIRATYNLAMNRKGEYY